MARYLIDYDIHLLAELRHGHREDVHDRAEILATIEGERSAREFDSRELHEAAGVSPGALFDGTMSTQELRDALIALRSLPGGQRFFRYNVMPSGRDGSRGMRP